MNQSNPLNVQVGGAHYKGVKLQPIQFAEMYQLSPSEFSIIRYITRWRTKNGMEDIDKVEHYLQLLIKMASDGILHAIPVNTSKWYPARRIPKAPEFLAQFPDLTPVEIAIATAVCVWRYPKRSPDVKAWTSGLFVEDLHVALELIEPLRGIAREALNG